MTQNARAMSGVVLILVLTALGFALAYRNVQAPASMTQASSNASASTTPESVNGVYFIVAIDGGNTMVATSTSNEYAVQLADPYFNGVFIKTTWSDLERKQGTYDWSDLDANVKAGEAAGKKVALGVRAGDVSPTWLYGEGVPSITATQPGPKNTCIPDTMPVPWNPTYLKEWTNFVAAFGAHYASDPQIVEIKMTGINDYSDETRLPLTDPRASGNSGCHPSLDDIALWQKAGFTPDVIFSTYKTIVNAFAGAFPRQALVTMGSVSAYDGMVTDVFMPWASEALGNRFIGAQNGWRPQNLDPGVLNLATSTGSAIGWQQGVPFNCHINGQNIPLKTEPCTFYEGLKEAFETALPTHPVYLELLSNFSSDPNNEDLIKQAETQIVAEPPVY